MTNLNLGIYLKTSKLPFYIDSKLHYFCACYKLYHRVCICDSDCYNSLASCFTLPKTFITENLWWCCSEDKDPLQLTFVSVLTQNVFIPETKLSLTYIAHCLLIYNKIIKRKDTQTVTFSNPIPPLDANYSSLLQMENVKFKSTKFPAPLLIVNL